MYQVLGVGLGFVAYSKVVDDEAKHDFSRAVLKETRSIGTLCVDILTEVLDKVGLAELAGLG
jgi:hypothetical protein